MFRCDLLFKITMLLLLLLGLCESVFSAGESINQNGGEKTGDSNTAKIKELLTSIDRRLNSLDQRLDQRIAALDRRIVALDQRFSSLEEQVSGPQLHKNKQILQDFRGVCAELLNASASGTEPELTTEKPMPPFQITKVTKQDRGDNFTLRVEYEATSTPTAILWRRGYSLYYTMLEDQDFGVVEVEVPNTRPKSFLSILYSTRLHFFFEDRSYTAILFPYDTPDVMEVPPIDFQVQQGHDVTFKPGSDVELDFKLRVGGDAEKFEGNNFRFDVVVKNNTEEETVNRYHSYSSEFSEGGLWARWEHEVEGDNTQQKLRVGSHTGDPECVLDVTADIGFNCSHNCLLYGLEYQGVKIDNLSLSLSCTARGTR